MPLRVQERSVIFAEASLCCQERSVIFARASLRAGTPSLIGQDASVFAADRTLTIAEWIVGQNSEKSSLRPGYCALLRGADASTR